MRARNLVDLVFLAECISTKESDRDYEDQFCRPRLFPSLIAPDTLTQCLLLIPEKAKLSLAAKRSKWVIVRGADDMKIAQHFQCWDQVEIYQVVRVTDD